MYTEQNKLAQLKHHSKDRRKFTQISEYWRRGNPIKYALQRARTNSKSRNQEFSITREDLVFPDKCPIFDVPFQYGTKYAASIDRIDNSKGYVSGNVQIISRFANLMKNDATKDELIAFAKWVMRTYE